MKSDFIAQGSADIPHVEMPFRRHCHRDRQPAHQMTRQWAIARSVLPDAVVTAFLDDLRYTDLIAGYYVGAPLPALTAINNFSLWFFVWDDRHDHYIRHHRDGAWARLRDDLHSALDELPRDFRTSDPLVESFADCVARLSERLGQSWASRFRNHFHATIDAYDQEYRNRTTQSIPTIEEYLELRRHTFGMPVWIDCLELAADVEFPEWIRESAPYRNAALASQEFAAWYNDLHSMSKEVAMGDFHNFGILLARHEGIPLQQAAVRLAAEIQDRIADYIVQDGNVRRLLDEVGAEPGLRIGVHHSLFNMRNWISSTYWFHLESSRYRVESWADPRRPPYTEYM